MAEVRAMKARRKAEPTTVIAAAAADKAVKMNSALYQRIDKEVEGRFMVNKLQTVVERGLAAETSAVFELDGTQKQQFFKHLSGGAIKEYQKPLVDLSLTEKELVALALERSGKTYAQLLKDALLSAAKESVTFAARNDHLSASGIGTIDERLQRAFTRLHSDVMEGRERPRGGRLKISRIASVAGVNLTSAKKWAQQNQPELL